MRLPTSTSADDEKAFGQVHTLKKRALRKASPSTLPPQGHPQSSLGTTLLRKPPIHPAAERRRQTPAWPQGGPTVHQAWGTAPETNL